VLPATMYPQNVILGRGALHRTICQAGARQDISSGGNS